MREEMELISSSKLNIKDDDNAHKVANKIASYAYKNSAEPTQEDVENALYARIIGQTFSNIEPVEDSDAIQKVVTFHGTDEKFPVERDDGKRFIFKANQNTRDVLILVDPNIKSTKHGEGLRYKSYSEIALGCHQIYYYRLDKLIGHDKVSRSLIDDYYASDLPSETSADAEKFASMYKQLTNPYYGQKKQAHQVEYNEILVEIGQDLVEQNFEQVRGKGWQVELGELKEYKWFDSETKKHHQGMFPVHYQVMKHNEKTKVIDHAGMYTHRMLATYQRYNEFDRMAYMKFFDQTLRHIYRDEINVQAMERYAMERSHDVASAWETKKNIPEATKQAMERTIFKEDFNFVEFDERVDLALLPKLETEWIAFRDVLPKADIKPDLRFRLLGHHRAAGIFVPLVNSIGIDPREERTNTDGEVIKIDGMTSLAHEYAHYLDYNFDHGDYPLSLRSDFAPLLEKYQKALDDLPTDHPYKMTTSKYGLDYYKTPTEVFARSFELYIANYDNVKSAFIKDTSEFERPSYQAFDGANELINDYFNERFPEMDQALKAFQPDISAFQHKKETIPERFDPFVEVEVSSDAYIPIELINSKELADIRGTQMSLDL